MPVPTPHNLTIVAGNSSGFVEVLQGVNNNLMGNLLGVMFLITVFAIGFLLSIGITRSSTKSFIFSSFGVFVMSIFLRLIGLIPDIILYVCLAMAALSVALVKNE